MCFSGTGGADCGEGTDAGAGVTGSMWMLTVFVWKKKYQTATAAMITMRRNHFIIKKKGGEAGVWGINKAEESFK